MRILDRELLSDDASHRKSDEHGPGERKVMEDLFQILNEGDASDAFSSPPVSTANDFAI